MAATFARSSPHEQEARNTLADINELASSHRLPRALRISLRRHIQLWKHIRRTAAQHEAITQLSPALQAEVCSMLYDELLKPIWFLKDCDYSLRVRLALEALPLAYEEGDYFITGGDCMYVLQHGSVMADGRVLAKGSYFGDDMIISNANFRSRCCVRILSDSANLLKLKRATLFDVAEQYPQYYKLLRRRAGLLGARRLAGRLVQRLVARGLRAAELLRDARRWRQRLCGRL